jgi:hypothetical protein
VGKTVARYQHLEPNHVGR